MRLNRPKSRSPVIITLASRPYRPHLPQPEHFRLVFTGEIERLAVPTNSAGVLQVLAEEAVALQTAEARFQAVGRFHLAELYPLANDLTLS